MRDSGEPGFFGDHDEDVGDDDDLFRFLVSHPVF